MTGFKKKILIIEDDLTMLNNIKIICETLGHEVLATFDRIDYKEIEPYLESCELLLLDINFPKGKSGLQFAEMIKKRFPVPIIYVTGNIESEIFERASDTIMHGFLPKPFTKDQLDFAIRSSMVRTEYEKMMRKQLENFFNKEKMIQVGEIASGLIHDLNNFNSIVLMNFELINNYSNISLTGEQKDKIDKYVKAGQQGAKRIDELSDRYKRILASNMDIEYSAFSLKKLFEEVRYYFRSKMKDNKVDVIVECDDDLDIYSAEIILLQSLVNLVSNSIDAIVEQELPEKWIKLLAQKVGSEVIINVVDSGTGIDQKIAAQMFDPGFTTKARTAARGTGFGLSYVKDNVEKHLQGSLDLDCAANHTTFKMVLPETVDH